MESKIILLSSTKPQKHVFLPMKKILLFPIVFIFSSLGINAQVTGLWKTVDDTDGVEKSIVEIFEKNGKLHGRVTKLLPGATKFYCEKCTGDLKNKPITGMVILNNLTKSSNGGTDGSILDPATGKSYTCYIELESSDKLKLRGYIGFPAFGRTQYWYRVK
jgi:uncharacterized protein (DUF2147 family)